MNPEESSSKLYITGTRLETYLTCPRKYYFANVRKLQKPFGKKSSLLAFDQALHKSLSSFYRFHNPKEPFDFIKLQKSLEYNWHNSNFETDEISAEYKEIALNSLKNYFSQYCNDTDKHIEIDFFFKTEISGIEYGGKIDRIDENEDGTLEIIDYKTGKLPSKGISELEDSLSIQMLFLACESIFPNKVNRLTFIYLKENQVLYIYRNEQKLEEILNKFKDISQRIKEEKFEPVVSNNCCWCDYKSNCPEGQKSNITPAKLKYYQDCPKKYSFKYIEKQPIINAEPKPALLFYSYITTMLTNIYKEKKVYAVSKLIDHAKKALNNHRELTEEIRENLLNDCKSAFEYINHELSLNGFPNSKVINTELKNSYDSAILSVKFDRIDELPDGKLQPVIYKTGKQTQNINSLSNDLSSAFYWYVANELYPGQIDSISFIYLLSGQIISFVPTDICINRLKEAISDFINEKKFEGKDGSLCSWCDYYGPCPNWKVKPYELVKESMDSFRQRIRLSYSKMSLYMNCPYAYKRLYIDKIAPNPQPFFNFGTAIHETFEKIYNPTDKDIIKPTLDEIIKLYEKIRLCHRDGFSNEQIEEEYRKDGIRQITLYYNHFIKDKTFKPAAAVEKYFEIPCGKYAVMTGSIDRIDQLEDDTYEILDYKTEPTLRTQEEVDHDKQLSIYYWAAKETMGYNISKLSLLMLDHDVKIKTTRVKKDIDNVLEVIDKTAYKMIHEQNFEPKKNKYCKSCDHLSSCPLKIEILTDNSLTSMQKFTDEAIDTEV